MSENEVARVPKAVSELVKMPPHPLDGEWYVHIDNETYGPYTGHRIRDFLKEERVTASTDVVRSGGSDWTRLDQDPTLSSLLSRGSDRPPPRLPSGNVSAQAGATVVQVTNSFAQPEPRIVLEDGVAKAKSPGVALLLSVFIVGLGQIYNGQVGKGIGMFVLCVATWFLFLGWIVMIWSWVDAYSQAKSMNDRYQRRLTLGMVV